MNIVIIGKGEMLANLIEGVYDAGFKVAGVLRYERTCYSNLMMLLKDFFKSAPEYTLIKKRKIYEIKCKSANSEQFKREILKLNADIIIVGTWREKIQKDIFNLPKIASINVHPSLLPKYRGPNPYIQTILHGEKQSGVTFHLLSEKIDEGAILAQQKIEILPMDTGKELKEKTVFQARLLLSEVLKKLNIGIIEPIVQDEALASYYPNISGDEKMLDFENMTSDEILNTIRALYPWLPAYITCNIKGVDLFYKVNPYRAKIINNNGIAGEILNITPNTHSMTIACKDGKAIRMSKLKLYRLPIFTKLTLRLVSIFLRR